MKKNIAVLGTGSDVGKSIIAAAICRSLVEQGEKVAPFKAQNMSNNSGITPEGLEMGRAQIVQAEAAKISPHVDMNPILLKPTGEKQSQVILNGEVYGNHTAMDYHKNKGFYHKAACRAFDRLSSRYERIVLEGAGSCAEVNLMPSDIVNLAMAEYANADVVLTADIHRGGVFAQLIGTLECLPQKHRDRIKGFIINRFRGDISLFKDGTAWIENRTGKPVFGVLPWYSHFKIDAEDSVEIEECQTLSPIDQTKPAIAIIRLPHIANFTDFHALFQIPELAARFIDRPMDLSSFKAVIIPGSKNTRADLEWIHKSFFKDLTEYVDKGGHVLGICGGYQMLGTLVDDPDGLEGKPGVTRGLGLLPVETALKAPKTTTLSKFEWGKICGDGYEIHMGQTYAHGGMPLVRIVSRNQVPCEGVDGCLREDKRVAGTYIHGFFDHPEICNKWLSMIGIDTKSFAKRICLADQKEKNYTLLRRHFESHVDLSSIY
ncbi:MAG: cobyric acid synthase [Desulfobacter sp.]|nr:cobyric acid synthase [Desulfobacter sp.]WDP84254.1 MAG: cobyric acid synthase [Desulfobacter sp.]